MKIWGKKHPHRGKAKAKVLGGGEFISLSQELCAAFGTWYPHSSGIQRSLCWLMFGV